MDPIELIFFRKGYHVYGTIRKSTNENTANIKGILKDPRLHLSYFDLTDGSKMSHLLAEIQKGYPDLHQLEIYNLAAISHVKTSFELPEYCAEINAVSVLRIIEAIRTSGFSVSFYQASTSELFGKVQEVPQNENTPFYPRSPYAVAKLFTCS